MSRRKSFNFSMYAFYNFIVGSKLFDEPMAGQINSGSNSLDANIDSIISSSNNLKARSFIKFGAFSGGCEANVEGRKYRQYGYFTSQENI